MFTRHPSERQSIEAFNYTMGKLGEAVSKARPVDTSLPWPQQKIVPIESPVIPEVTIIPRPIETATQEIGAIVTQQLVEG